MAQNFIAEDYSKTGKTNSVIKRRFSTDLLLTSSQSSKFAVINDDIRLFDYWFVDLRDFLFFMPGYQDNNPKMNISTVSFDFLGTTFFGPKYFKSYWYGYYQLDFSQAEEELLHIWVSNTFTGLLSNLGGYAAVITGFFGMLLGNY